MRGRWGKERGSEGSVFWRLGQACVHHTVRLCAGVLVQILPLTGRCGVLRRSITPPISAFPLLNTRVLGTLLENHHMCPQFNFTGTGSSSFMYFLQIKKQT